MSMLISVKDPTGHVVQVRPLKAKQLVIADGWSLVVADTKFEAIVHAPAPVAPEPKRAPLNVGSAADPEPVVEVALEGQAVPAAPAVVPAPRTGKILSATGLTAST